MKNFLHGLTLTPKIFHAAVIIFLEFFAFGLLTAPMISVLDEAFPRHALLMNGFVQGIKGFLSFLSAPLIGSLSDLFGRKPFLLLTVTFTCCPLPLIKISHLWYFTFISLSGIFSVTFSVVLAFVSDITTVENRSWAYGLVSAMFAASLIISPALGAFLENAYSVNFVVMLATFIALMDILFIIFCVPESLHFVPKRESSSSPTSTTISTSPAQGSGEITWNKVDPFGALRRMGTDRVTLVICLTTFLSYLPEAGEYSCFFVYLSLVMGFSEEAVALFIAMCGIISCFAQTIGLSLMISCLNAKNAIVVGLALETIQLAIFGFFNSPWILWSAGSIAGLGSITYPALSAFLSSHAKSDQQGFAQGLLTGIRGLCLGLGPALYGFIFYLFQVDLTNSKANKSHLSTIFPPNDSNLTDKLTFMKHLKTFHESLLPGPPFAFGSVLALLAMVVALFIPEDISELKASGSYKSRLFRDDNGNTPDADDMSQKLESLEDSCDEKDSFIPSEDGHRRTRNKSNQKDFKSNRVLRTPSKSDEANPLYSLHSPLYRALTRPKSRSKFTYPLMKFFHTAPRIRSSTVEQEPLKICAALQDTEAADLANYRHARMPELLQSKNEYEFLEDVDVHIGQRGVIHNLLFKGPQFGNSGFDDGAIFSKSRSSHSHKLLPVKSSPIDQRNTNYFGGSSHRELS